MRLSTFRALRAPLRTPVRGGTLVGKTPQAPPTVQQVTAGIAQALQADFAALRAAVNSLDPAGSNVAVVSSAANAALRQMLSSDLPPYNDAGYMRQRGKVINQGQIVGNQLNSQIFPLAKSIYALGQQIGYLTLKLSGSKSANTGSQIDGFRIARLSRPADRINRRSPRPPTYTPPPNPGQLTQQQQQQLQNQLAQAKAQLQKSQNALTMELKTLAPLLAGLGGMLTASFLAGSSTAAVPPPSCPAGQVFDPTSGQCQPIAKSPGSQPSSSNCASTGYSTDANGNCVQPCLPGYIPIGVQRCQPEAAGGTKSCPAGQMADGKGNCVPVDTTQAVIAAIKNDVINARASVTAGNTALNSNTPTAIQDAQTHLQAALSAIADATSQISSAGLSGYGGLFGFGGFSGLGASAEAALASAKADLLKVTTSAQALQTAIQTAQSCVSGGGTWQNGKCAAPSQTQNQCLCPDGVTPCPDGQSQASCPGSLGPSTLLATPPGGGDGGGPTTPCACPDGTPCPNGDPTQCLIAGQPAGQALATVGNDAKVYGVVGVLAGGGITYALTRKTWAGILGGLAGGVAGVLLGLRSGVEQVAQQAPPGTLPPGVVANPMIGTGTA